MLCFGNNFPLACYILITRIAHCSEIPFWVLKEYFHMKNDQRHLTLRRLLSNVSFGNAVCSSRLYITPPDQNNTTLFCGFLPEETVSSFSDELMTYSIFTLQKIISNATSCSWGFLFLLLKNSCIISCISYLHMEIMQMRICIIDVVSSTVYSIWLFQQGDGVGNKAVACMHNIPQVLVPNGFINLKTKNLPFVGTHHKYVYVA